MDEWGVPLLKMCEDYISTLIREKRKEEGQNGDARELESLTYLFTLGEVAQVRNCNKYRDLGGYFFGDKF